MRQKIGVPEENGLNIRICLGAAEDWGTGGEWTEQLKKRKLAKYGRWKRRIEGLDMAATEGEIEGKSLPGRRRRIEYVWVQLG